MAGEADHLVAVAELVVIPQIQDHGLAVFADLGGRRVEDAGARVADAVAADELGIAAEADLFDEVALKAGLASPRFRNGPTKSGNKVLCSRIKNTKRHCGK